MEEEEEISNNNSIVSFKYRLSVARKLMIIKYVEERSIPATSNYFGASRPTIRYWIK